MRATGRPTTASSTGLQSRLMRSPHSHSKRRGGAKEYLRGGMEVHAAGHGGSSFIVSAHPGVTLYLRFEVGVRRNRYRCTHDTYHLTLHDCASGKRQ